jgi:ornithine cyclodeaminase/alanine dehydrogenase-like protein (mu-crystallin family)
MRGAFQALSDGTAYDVPRVRAKGKGIILHSMCAAADYLGLVGWKQYTTTRDGARFLVGLYSQETGELLALIEADRLGQLRTGAVTGLAVDLLAPGDVARVGLFGTGWQAASQLEAVAAVRPLEQVFCFSRREDKRREFAERMSAVLSVEVVPVANAREAVDGVPIVITATSSRAPVFEGEWLENGSLVCAAGSNWLNKAEIDLTTIRRAGAIICDSIECCKNEAGDLVPAIESGDFEWSQAVELADVVAGKATVNTAPNAITIFKSVGMAIEDVALGAMLLDLVPASQFP